MTTSTVALLASASRTADGVGAAVDCNLFTNITFTLTSTQPASGYLRSLSYEVRIETSANGTTGWTPLHTFDTQPHTEAPYTDSGLPDPRVAQTEGVTILLADRLRYLRAVWTCHDQTTGVAEAAMTFGITGPGTDV